MSRLSDPPRLRSPGSSASKAARALLEASRSELPDAGQLARLAQRLPGLGAGGPAASGAGHPLQPPTPPVPPAPLALSAAPAAASTGGGALIGAALALAVVYGVWRRDTVNASSAAPVRPVSAAVGAARLEPPVPIPALAPDPGAPQAPEVTDPPRSPAPSATVTRSAASAPAAVADASGHADLPGGSPLEAGGPPPGDAETEIELLRRAQHALPGQPAAALAAVEDHVRRFPGGALAQEREVIAVSALVALGRRGEAEARAGRFLASYPRSPHRAGIEALVHGPASGP